MNARMLFVHHEEKLIHFLPRDLIHCPACGESGHYCSAMKDQNYLISRSLPPIFRESLWITSSSVDDWMYHFMRLYRVQVPFASGGRLQEHPFPVSICMPHDFGRASRLCHVRYEDPPAVWTSILMWSNNFPSYRRSYSLHRLCIPHIPAYRAGFHARQPHYNEMWPYGAQGWDATSGCDEIGQYTVCGRGCGCGCRDVKDCLISCFEQRPSSNTTRSASMYLI